MKNILLTLIVFGIVGCTSTYSTYGGLDGYSRYDELRFAGYTSEQILEAIDAGRYDELVDYARRNGLVQKGYEQYLRNQKIAAQNQNYIDQKIALCKSYGYTNQNLISQCVEREVNIDRQRIAAQAQQQSKKQKNLGLAIAEELSKIGSQDFNYNNQKTSICQFKSIEGRIISGDCKQIAIKDGNTIYWKVD